MEDLKTLLAYFKEHKKASLLSSLQLSWGPHWGWQLFITAGLAENWPQEKFKKFHRENAGKRKTILYNVSEILAWRQRENE